MTKLSKTGTAISGSPHRTFPSLKETHSKHSKESRDTDSHHGPMNTNQSSSLHNSNHLQKHPNNLAQYIKSQH